MYHLTSINMPCLIQPPLLPRRQQRLRLPTTGIALLAPVDDVVLNHEQHVKEDANLAEAKLDGVGRDAAPVVLQVAVNRLLGDAEHAARNVQQDLVNRPALGALVADVGEQLRRVLDQRHHELDVAERVHDVEVAPAARRIHGAAARLRADNDVGDGHAGKGARREAEHEAAGAGPRVVGGKGPEAAAEEVLRDGDGGEDEAVEGKDEVVELHGRGVPVVAGGVLPAHAGGVVEGGAGGKVAREA